MNHPSSKSILITGILPLMLRFFGQTYVKFKPFVLKQNNLPGDLERFFSPYLPVSVPTGRDMSRKISFARLCPPLILEEKLNSDMTLLAALIHKAYPRTLEPMIQRRFFKVSKLFSFSNCQFSQSGRIRCFIRNSHPLVSYFFS